MIDYLCRPGYQSGGQVSQLVQPGPERQGYAGRGGGKQADKDAWAEGQAEAQADEIYPHFDDDFAQGGLAYLLGE